MSSWRLMIRLFVIVGLLFAAAIMVTTGTSPGGLLTTAGTPSGGLERLGAGLGGLDGWKGHAAALAFGWCARWLYDIPWGDIPETIAEWFLGWRRSALLTVLGAACVAVLVFI
jgi:hypothetical protein